MIIRFREKAKEKVVTVTSITSPAGRLAEEVSKRSLWQTIDASRVLASGLEQVVGMLTSAPLI